MELNTPTKVVDRIKKLLKLSNSPNEHEAELALQRAHEMMAEHNVKLASMDLEDDPYIEITLAEAPRSPVEFKFIFHLVELICMVKVFRAGGYSGKPMTMKAFGRQSQMVQAQYVFDYLRETIIDLWEKARKENNFKLSGRQPYMSGFRSAMVDKLEDSRENLERDHEEACTALMKIDADLEVAIKEQYGRFYASQVAGYCENAGANTAGYKDGQKTSVNKGIAGGKNTRLLNA